jgi:hypothetical protein
LLYLDVSSCQCGEQVVVRRFVRIAQRDLELDRRQLAQLR